MPAPSPEPWSAKISAPFGVIGVAIRDGFVTAIRYLPPGGRLLAPDDALAREACRQIEAYLQDPRFPFSLRLRPPGNDHQRRAWRAMAAIPAGHTLSYGELAAAIGSSARAVGQACGANPLPLVIPCHRVVARDGSLGGFMGRRGGFALSVKRWLLEHERG
ncbi:MAG TPA: methylated-DNA--[protein]-cysteine S-methyltransferase [Burkholderiales bacterium]|nr:methylated-DNA--[protein]-cysteine S-methyltransferase [Burkholderiales bacterium]